MALRVLVAGPALRVPWVEDTADAFRRLGHATSLFYYNNLWVNRASSGRVARTFAWVPPVLRRLARYRDGWQERREQALIARTRQVRPDLVVVLRGESIADDTIGAVKGESRGPVVTWWLDDPWRYLTAVERVAAYDHVFVFDRSYLRRLGAMGITHASFLPCACNETVYRPKALRPWERRHYRCDIALVAWYYPNRGKVVKALAEFDVNIWGRGWASPEARRSLDGMARMVRGARFVPAERAATIYRAATIGLNIHSDQTHEAGLNMRTFELLATGTFPLIDAVPGMDELLVPGKEVATYRSAAELRDLAAYYLSHPAERTRLVARGRERTLREHTYVHRMQAMLRTISA